MGKKFKRQPKSFLQKEHEENEEREEEVILQEKLKPNSQKQAKFNNQQKRLILKIHLEK